MKKYIAPIIAMMFLDHAPSHADTLQNDFITLFERCRIAIENSTSLNVADLQPVKIPEKHKRSMEKAHTGWSFSNSAFYITHTSWISKRGITRNACRVNLRNPDHRFSANEQERLRQRFLRRQEQLVGEGTHEIDPNARPAPSLTIHAFLKVARNPNGCVITNYIAFIPDSTFFTAVSAAQATKDCLTKPAM